MRLDDQVILLINLYKKCETLCVKESLSAPNTILTIFKSEADILVQGQKIIQKAVDLVVAIYAPTAIKPTSTFYNERRTGGC